MEERLRREIPFIAAEHRNTKTPHTHALMLIARRGREPLVTVGILNELVAESLTMIRPMARMKELLVEETKGEPPRVACDPFAVRQMLLNLLLNALDFARSRIVITTSRSADGDAEVIVADDGPGVPPQDRERIFQRFVTTRAGGNGLGEHYLKLAAEMNPHHGAFHIHH